MPRNNYAYSDKLKPYARDHRRKPTPQERDLWYRYLIHYPVKFHRQRMIGVYIADFYCAAAKLIIELDGSQHYTEQGIVNDRSRTAGLGEFSIEVLRFSNAQIDHSFSEVCRSIDQAVKRRLEELKME